MAVIKKMQIRIGTFVPAMKILTHAVVLDDHRLFADSFALFLKNECAIDMVQSFSRTDDFFQFLRAFGKQELYVFLDYYFPNENGLALLTEIRRLNEQGKIIFVTSAIAPTVIRSMIPYRPEGILSKSCDTQTVIECLKSVTLGKPYVALEFAQMMISSDKKNATFTAREVELLKYFSKGYSVAETATQTFLSPHTVVAHRRKMMAKANCQTIAQMLTYARDNDLI